MNGVGLGALGATTFYGEFGQYNDQFDAGAISALSGFGLGPTSAISAPTTALASAARLEQPRPYPAIL